MCGRFIDALSLVGSDRQDLEARARRLMGRRGDSGAPGAYLENLGPERIAGTPDQVLDRLAAYAKTGIQRVMLQHLVHDDLESLALIGERIIPEAASL